MDLYINLQKAMDTAKLVKRAVQVRGQNGKIFTRMQWVNPNDASTGNGVRTVHDEASMKEAMADGIHHHPNFHSALKEQGIHDLKDHDFHKHPAIHLPETPDSHSKHLSRKESGQHSLGLHIPHGHRQVPDHIEDKNLRRVMHREGIHPEIHQLKDAILSELQGTGDSLLLDKASKLVKKHWGIVGQHINEHIELDHDVPDYVRAIQKNALNHGGTWHIASHPVILSSILERRLGAEHLESTRKVLSNSNLTINFGDQALGGIEKEGYYASTLEGFLDKHLGQDAVNQLREVYKMGGDEMDKFDYLEDKFMSGDSDFNVEDTWGQVIERGIAEYEAIGLKLQDSKPTYLAYNPSGGGTGGAEEYGDHYLSLKDPNSALRMSTATKDDSFFDKESVPKVWDMNHLTDIFIMKALSYGYKPEQGAEAVSNYTGEIPVEVQYHSPSIDRSKYDIHKYKD